MSFNGNTDYSKNYQPAVAERYTHKSYVRSLAKAKFNFAGAREIAIYSHAAPTMNDYNRSHMKGANGVESRYGDIQDIDMVTQTIKIEEDKAASFTVDALDMATTAGALKVNEVLKSFTDETAIPYFDKYTIKKWHAGVGDVIVASSIDSSATDKENTATFCLQDATEKFLENNIDGEKICICTPEFAKHLKRSDYFIQNAPSEVIHKGQVGTIDDWAIIVVPKRIMPSYCWALCVDPRALVCEEKLDECKVITNSERVSGALINVRQSFVAGTDWRKTTGIIAIVSSDDRPDTATIAANRNYSTSDSSESAGVVIARGVNDTSHAYGVYLDSSTGRWSKVVATS